jgi:propanediol dehydratase large subunit
MAEVSMDYDAVQGMSDGFSTAADTLRAVSQALEVAIAILKATAFLGLVGNMALASYLEGIKPNVDRLGNTCEELSMDLIGAIVSLRDGDYSGSQRFV